MKSDYRRKQDAKERESKALQRIKNRLGVRPAKPLRGATPSPLVAKPWQRKANRRQPLTASPDRLRRTTSCMLPNGSAVSAKGRPRWRKFAARRQRLRLRTTRARCNICPTKGNEKAPTEYDCGGFVASPAFPVGSDLAGGITSLPLVEVPSLTHRR